MKISCIIPTYNEGSRIGNILKELTKHPQLDEIIVVDDGSKDNTKEVLAQFPTVRAIIQPKNGGKSFAIATGIKAATGDFLIFIDADLEGLTNENITKIIEPALKNEADVCISLRNYKLWKWVGLDPLSGERVFPRKMMEPHIEAIGKLRPFGLEVFMNREIIIKNHLRVKIVLWENVMSPTKYTKQGIWQGIKGDVKMVKDIFSTVGVREGFRQIVELKKLKIA